MTGDAEDIDRVLSEEFKDDPAWALKIKCRGVQGVVFNLWSPWVPNIQKLEILLEKYESLWIKNEWSEEGGMAGVWLGWKREGSLVVKQLDWNEGCLEAQAHMFRPIESKSDKEEQPPNESQWSAETVEEKAIPCASVPKKKVLN